MRLNQYVHVSVPNSYIIIGVSPPCTQAFLALIGSSDQTHLSLIVNEDV
jgi:hypothetical protein